MKRLRSAPKSGSDDVRQLLEEANQNAQRAADRADEAKSVVDEISSGGGVVTAGTPDVRKAVRCLKYEIKRLKRSGDSAGREIEEGKRLAAEAKRAAESAEANANRAQGSTIELRELWAKQQGEARGLLEKYERALNEIRELVTQEDADSQSKDGSSVVSGHAEELKKGLRCLKYELKKLKQVRGLETIRLDIAGLRDDLERLAGSTKAQIDDSQALVRRARDEVDDLKDRISDANLRLREAKEIAERAEDAVAKLAEGEGGVVTAGPEDVKKALRCLKYELKKVKQNRGNGGGEGDVSELRTAISRLQADVETLRKAFSESVSETQELVLAGAAGADDAEGGVVSGLDVRKGLRCLKYELKKLKRHRSVPTLCSSRRSWRSRDWPRRPKVQPKMLGSRRKKPRLPQMLLTGLPTKPRTWQKVLSGLLMMLRIPLMLRNRRLTKPRMSAMVLSKRPMTLEALLVMPRSPQMRRRLPLRLLRKSQAKPGMRLARSNRLWRR
jgi:ABC-type transporter Mla subunit MlaD